MVVASTHLGQVDQLNVCWLKQGYNKSIAAAKDPEQHVLDIAKLISGTEPYLIYSFTSNSFEILDFVPKFNHFQGGKESLQENFSQLLPRSDRIIWKFHQPPSSFTHQRERE